MEEVNRIEKADLKVDRLNFIRDVFVFCCYTGLAYAEVHALKPEHVYIGIDGEKWLNIFRKKTKKHYQVPILPKAMEIMDKYSNHPKCIKNDVLLPVNSNVKMNAYLKEIADLARIRQKLTVHIARKTYACTLLAQGVNIGVLSKLLGHSSIQVTLDSYTSVMDELMLNNVKMMREKFVAKADKYVINELTDISASKDLAKKFKTEEGLN